MINWDKIAKWLPWNNPTGASIFILVLIVLFFVMPTCESAETTLEGGISILSNEYSDGQYLIIEERFADGRYGLALGIVGEQVCKCREGQINIDANLFVSAMIYSRWKRFELGLGPSYWANKNRALGAHFNVRFSLGFRIWKRLYLKRGHASNGGSADPNLGEDGWGLRWGFVFD